MVYCGKCGIFSNFIDESHRILYNRRSKQIKPSAACVRKNAPPGNKKGDTHDIVKKVQTALAKADATKVEEHIAIQVNVTGDAEGAFYMEISGGVLYVAAYDYNDRDALLTADGADVLAVAQGKISLQEAISSGKIAHEGDYGKTLMLGDTIPQKKTAAKKAEAPAAAQTAAPAEKPKRGRKPGSKKTTK